MGASGNITAYVLSHHDMHNDLQEALRGGNPDTVPLPLVPATIAQRMVFRLFGPRKWLSGSTKLYLLKQATIRPEVRKDARMVGEEKILDRTLPWAATTRPRISPRIASSQTQSCITSLQLKMVIP